MDEIDEIGREAKNKVYSKDVFGRGKSLITDVSTQLFLEVFRTETGDKMAIN